MTTRNKRSIPEEIRDPANVDRGTCSTETQYMEMVVDLLDTINAFCLKHIPNRYMMLLLLTREP